ncbi:MAG TPA: hypothetical protein VHZ03_04335 [Trebonia sp.]|jgi:hypothetical protein|nr:hypothetical protein [Trebonia sp.]
MLEDVAMAISTGAAGNIVAYMLNGRVDALRDQVTKIFRHGNDQERSAVLRTLEDDAIALTQGKESGTDMTTRWSNSLLAYLTAHPEARGDIEAFASSPVTSKTIIVGSQKHCGSGANIAGDYYGNMTFEARDNPNG